LEWAEKIMSTDGKVLVPKPFLEATFRAAKTPRSVRAKYLNGHTPVTQKADASNWKVGAARDLPLDDSGVAWDGPAAAASIFASAGFEGDNPDSAKARRGFLIYDSANPTLKGSYKLPFATMSGGTMKAMPSGIRAAASRLPQTDAPSSVLDDARKVIDAYETKMGAGENAADKALDGHSDLTAVAALAWLLDRLADHDVTEKDAVDEETDVSMASHLQATIASLGQILVDMPAEEVAELAVDDGDGGMMTMMLAARTPGQKALMRLAMIAQSKAGRVLSAANSALLEQAKACHTKALDCMDNMSSAMSGAMDQHQKACALHKEAMGCVKAVIGGDQEDPAEDQADATGEDAADHIMDPPAGAGHPMKANDEAEAAAAEAERQRRNRARARALAAVVAQAI